MLTTDFAIEILIAIFSASIALALFVLMLQESVSLRDFVQTFFVCLVYETIITVAIVANTMLNITGQVTDNFLLVWLSWLIAWGVFFLSIWLLIRWGGFSIWGAVIATLIAAFLQWCILTGTNRLLEKLAGA